ncbi:integrin alpha [Streptomyces cellulosae]|uniref:FG-GAP-like repeat-containing protein n=2 Tax=Streptomyces TaxID=1883 RepID=UPI00225AB428|nr:integrin alpha [Streptomyces cellulosae]WTB82043.1 integrin alpha [Streptomyces cellulosae]WTB88943.1 integrin alpha [Streptomyces cellulosae]WTC56232.1 integrin alpha [Streptomyces cellulosae]
MRTRTLAAALAVATAAAGLSLTLAPTASAAASVPDDFNGDGVADLVVATPHAPVDGRVNAGSVTVLYGSPDGVSPGRSTTLTQNSAGVPGDAGSHSLFGATHASGDLDADGYADLVIGAPGEAVRYSSSYGTLTVLWGGPDGLTGDGISMASPYATSEWSSEKDYGKKVVVADLDGDGVPQIATLSRTNLWAYDDLAGRTAPTDVARFHNYNAYIQPRTLTAADFTGAGSAQLVVTGGENCEGTTGGCQHTAVYTWSDTGLHEAWLPDPGGDVSGTNEAPTVSTAAGDVDGDGYADLVTGHVPASATTTGEYSDAAGFVHVRYGSADGLGAHRTATLDAPGGGRAGDNVGASVAVGDVTGDGYDDVVAGAPGATVRGVAGTGAAVLLRGSATGLTEADAQAVHQSTDGVPGTAEADDWFGSAVDLTDLDGDGVADVTIAAKGEDVLAGSVRDGADWVLRGSAAGLTTTGATSFSAQDVGLTAPDAEFGSVLGD